MGGQALWPGKELVSLRVGHNSRLGPADILRGVFEARWRSDTGGS